MKRISIGWFCFLFLALFVSGCQDPYTDATLNISFGEKREAMGKVVILELMDAGNNPVMMGSRVEHLAVLGAEGATQYFAIPVPGGYRISVLVGCGADGLLKKPLAVFELPPRYKNIPYEVIVSDSRVTVNTGDQSKEQK